MARPSLPALPNGILRNSVKSMCAIVLAAFGSGNSFGPVPSPQHGCARLKLPVTHRYFSAVMDDRATPITWNGESVSFTFSWKESSPTFASSTILLSASPPTTPVGHAKVTKHS